MKKALLSLLLVFFFGCPSFAQLVGQFRYEQGRLYLFVTNPSYASFTVINEAHSPLRRVTKKERINITSGGGFYLGPSSPWAWQWCEGDYLTVTYPDGSSQTWTCYDHDYPSGPSFKAGALCHYVFGTARCQCIGFREGPNFATCKCGHARSKHY